MKDRLECAAKAGNIVVLRDEIKKMWANANSEKDKMYSHLPEYPSTTSMMDAAIEQMKDETKEKIIIIWSIYTRIFIQQERNIREQKRENEESLLTGRLEDAAKIGNKKVLENEIDNTEVDADTEIGKMREHLTNAPVYISQLADSMMNEAIEHIKEDGRKKIILIWSIYFRQWIKQKRSEHKQQEIEMDTLKDKLEDAAKAENGGHIDVLEYWVAVIKRDTLKLDKKMHEHFPSQPPAINSMISEMGNTIREELATKLKLIRSIYNTQRAKIDEWKQKAKDQQSGALIITNSYINEKKMATEQDGVRMATRLRDMGFKIWHHRDLTAREIRNVFDEVSSDFKGDLLVVYFAGHGSQKGSIVGEIHEEHNDEESKLEGNSRFVSSAEVQSFVKGISANVLLLLDCCYSGKVLPLGYCHEIENEKWTMKTNVLADAYGDKQVIVISGCRSDEAACEFKGIGAHFTAGILAHFNYWSTLWSFYTQAHNLVQDRWIGEKQNIQIMSTHPIDLEKRIEEVLFNSGTFSRGTQNQNGERRRLAENEDRWYSLPILPDRIIEESEMEDLMKWEQTEDPFVEPPIKKLIKYIEKKRSAARSITLQSPAGQESKLWKVLKWIVPATALGFLAWWFPNQIHASPESESSSFLSQNTVPVCLGISGALAAAGAYVYSRFWRSEPLTLSESQYSSEQSESQSKRPSNDQRTLWIIIVVSILGFLVIVTIFCLCCREPKRAKRKVREDEPMAHDIENPRESRVDICPALELVKEQPRPKFELIKPARMKWNAAKQRKSIKVAARYKNLYNDRNDGII